MADGAARRREIRRQRILANSESRLRRILSNEEGNGPRKDPSVQPGSGQLERPPISVVNSITSPENRSIARLQQNSQKSSVENIEPNVGLNGGIRQLLREDKQFPTTRSTLVNTPMPAQPNYNPIASMDFADIPIDELPLFGQQADGAADTRQQLSHVGDHLEPLPPMLPIRMFNSNHAQLISHLAISDEAPLTTLANFGSQLSLHAPGLEGIMTRKGKRSTCDTNLRHYQLLWDASSFHRTLIVVFLAVLNRFIIPILPTDYALMFGPFYLLEILLMSLCTVYAVPLDQSKMSFAFNLLLLLGAPSRPIQFGRKLTTCLELFFWDMSTYSFAFFITHALCQHADSALAMTQ
ncbi:hypothetical protein BIW11_10268 [Tropilaelaps mercedesae]|uniref:Calcium signal-modulating cyclophilin ligand-like n=1 Tax=Tropilaelaps mercedesae TaxID=418985 RepID=A0A1V9XGY0_9ACAR|nr:hypothetical protein BIW11_10268 [Tropilaelaps mercedesae]